MRVMVYKEKDGEKTCTIVPGRAKHLPPLTIKGRPGKAFRDAVATAIKAVEDAPKVV